MNRIKASLLSSYICHCVEIWVLDAVLVDLPDGPAETPNRNSYIRWLWHFNQDDFLDSLVSINLFLGLFHHVFHISTQLLWWLNARRRQPLWSTYSVLTSLSVTSRASTLPFSAGTPLAYAGAWTAAARPSLARPCGDARSVQEVKLGDSDLWYTVVTDKKHNQHSLVYISSLSSPYDAGASEGDGRLGRWRWVQQIG